MQLNDNINLEWQTPRGLLLEQVAARIDQLEKIINPVIEAINDVLLPMSDKLAIRCLLDVFLDQQGYSEQSCGSRRVWVEEDNSSTGSSVREHVRRTVR